MIVERIALVDSVWNSATTHRLLDHKRLSISTIEYRRLAPLVTLVEYRAAQVVGHQFGLLAVGIGLDHVDFFAHLASREALLVKAVRVARDDAICRIYNGLRRAIVLLQLKDLSHREVALEVQDVLDICATERVDTLRVVAHHADVRIVLRQAADDDILSVVSILILID